MLSAAGKKGRRKMKWLNGYRIRVVLAGFVAAILAGDGGKVYGDFTFGKPQNLGPVINSPSGDVMGCFSADNLELYFSSNRPGGYGAYDLWVSTRESTNDPWGPPINLGALVNSTNNEICSSISSDGLTLYFCDDWESPFRTGGLGGADLWMSTRASRGAPWGTAVNVGTPINSSAGEIDAKISGDGLTLVFASNRAGGKGSYDLWMSTRATVQDNWGAPVNMGGVVNGGSFDHAPSLSSDKRALVFTSDRPGGFGGYDLWMTTRNTPSDPWAPPVNLGPSINSSGHEDLAAISADARMLYFLAHTPPGGFGGYDLWEAPIIPVVDFNSDGTVDIQDLVILIEHWGTSDTLCDIGPMPWGDGKVDEKDLEVLMRYWGQEILDPKLAAYWKLDETSGMMAADSIGANNGTLVGNPTWQPTGGKVKGALQFDGIDDYVSTPFVVDPSKQAFSVFAWVKGGGPGQVIVSQVSGANWVMAGASDGGLATELQSTGRTGQALKSAARITDGAWHRMGFVWDGSNRVLYVDDVEVAKDTQTSLAASSGVLYLGAGSSLAPGTFWFGLIDDVRICNQAMKP
jgi:hypothetical protein